MTKSLIHDIYKEAQKILGKQILQTWIRNSTFRFGYTDNFDYCYWRIRSKIPELLRITLHDRTILSILEILGLLRELFTNKITGYTIWKSEYFDIATFNKILVKI